MEGLWNKPTVVNNVETLANIAPIILNGAEWFRKFGTPKCLGTKVYTLVGDINNKGLIEVPMGITLREIVYEIGGGIPGGRKFKMAQTGGTSGVHTGGTHGCSHGLDSWQKWYCPWTGYHNRRFHDIVDVVSVL